LLFELERTEVLCFETDDGEELYGWYCRAKNPIASALYCHGNTGNLSNTARRRLVQQPL
jgi:hypothetical protein